MKKTLSILLALLMLLPLALNVSAEHRMILTDINENDAFYESVYNLVDSGVISGFEDNTFRPYNGLTRAELCKVINLAFGYTEKDEVNFADVTTADWFCDYVLVAKKAGYIKGFEDGTFRGNEKVTKEQFCAIINRIVGLYLIPIDITVNDEISEWARTDVMSVLTNYLMTPDEYGMFHATEPIFRYEMANVISTFVSGRGDDKPVVDEDGKYVCTVEHYKMNLDAKTYSLFETDEYHLVPGEKINAQPKTYEGFTENTAHSKRIASAVVSSTGATVLRLYYDRDLFTVTFKDRSQTVSEKEYVYESKIELPAAPKRAGYTFVGWYADGKKLDDSYKVKSDVTAEAKWSENVVVTLDYTVEHYKQTPDGEDYELFESDVKKNVSIGDEFTADPKTYEHFTFNSSISTVSGTVSASGLTLKLYYDRDLCTVSYYDFDGEPCGNEQVLYGALFPERQGEVIDGYIFICWTYDEEYLGDEPETPVLSTDTVTGDASVYAFYSEDEEVKIIAALEEAVSALDAGYYRGKKFANVRPIAAAVKSTIELVLSDHENGATITKSYVNGKYGDIISATKQDYNALTKDERDDFKTELGNHMKVSSAEILRDYFF